MLAETRRREIAETLRAAGAITVAEVESRFGVSAMTARRDLSDPALAHGTIGALAATWGFTDPARFSRAFRAAYGCSPTEARAAATLGRLDWD